MSEHPSIYQGTISMQKVQRLQALADLVVKRERVECDCKNAVIHDTFKKPVCFKCHGTGYVDEVKPGALLEATEKLLSAIIKLVAVDGKLDQNAFNEAQETIAEARRLGGLE